MKAVGLRRLCGYALAAGGEPAVSAMLTVLKREIRATLGQGVVATCLG